MTADEVLESAMSICTDLGATVPSAKSVWYRRLGIRQGQIFTLITNIDPDYFGVSSVVTLVAQAYALSGLTPKCDRVNDVRVLDPGSSGLRLKERVNLVQLEDADAHIPPRAVIRDQVLVGLDSDLSGVASVTIHYARRPAASASIVGASVIELPDQFTDLLTLDLARQMLRKLLDVEPARRDGWLELLSGAEADLLGVLDTHVRYFVGGEQRRFSPASPPVAGTDAA